MIGQSQSGTGKTAAFALTMLSRIDMDLKQPQVLTLCESTRKTGSLTKLCDGKAICIAPSRELALQNMSVIQRMGEYTPVECFHAGRDSVKRGMPRLTQQIIVGTPGTIIDVGLIATSLRRY
jgi:ATP-dependent RNA helicase DDX19/DBP5